MSNIQINIIENGTTTLATSGCICDRNIDINVDVPTADVDGVPTDEELTITGNCSHKFSNGGWNWFIEKYKDRIKTKDITYAERMFSSLNLKEIPFVLNFKDMSGVNLNNMFNSSKLEKAPSINIPNGNQVNLNALFHMSDKLTDANDVIVNEDEFIEQWKNYQNKTEFSNHYLGGTFNGCVSLRTVPTWFKRLKLNPESTAYPYPSYTIYYRPFMGCRVLDEVTDFPVWYCSAAQQKNMFDGTFADCSRVKEITFETNEDGTPIVVQWKSQILNLASSIGNGLKYNICDLGGMPIDKEVKDDATYQALKNDPDWWTTNIAYSRYNHDSAVNTINSLPDTSAYLATAGGTNTIKFYGANGSKTDGGAISTLTEEEIAVATAKGWTVEIV